MTSKTAYIWGPVSSFSGPLVAWLLNKGWHVHIATKGAFHFALSPLDLRSTAQESLARALGGQDRYKTFQDRLRFLDVNDSVKGTTYDAIIFCGLPPNFDEARVSRAPWAAGEFTQLARKFKGVPTFIVSSLWGAIQTDGVVPEEIECERRKPLSQFEGVCQQYETRILKELGKEDAHWYLVRLPMVGGSTIDGRTVNFSGPMTLFEKIVTGAEQHHKEKQKALALNYNPDSTFWFMPVDVLVYLFWRLLEDETRPRICNLVSTQATLNREWLQDLAKVLGFKKAASIEGDPFNLPAALRKSMNDNIQVKTRGLFEVMGRYQQAPTILDQQYFEKVIEYGRTENWGRMMSTNGAKPPLAFSEDLATGYFLSFLPENLDADFLKAVSAGNMVLGFNVEEGDNLSWILKSENDHPVVEPAGSQTAVANVRFFFSGQAFVKLIQRKESLERALVLRQARVEGSPLDVLKACNFLKRFFKDHPYKIESHADDEPASRPLQKVAKK